MHWILQPNFYNEAAYETLVETLKRFNIPYSIEKYAYGAFENEPQLTSKNVMCMGTYAMRNVARERGWYPGVFDLEPYDFLEQRKHWGTHMLNHDAMVMPFHEVNIMGDMFLRPLQDSKVFDGKVYQEDFLRKWQSDVNAGIRANGSSMTADTMVQVCYPKKILSEYRFWIVKGEIITASVYRRGGKVFYSSEVEPCFYDYVRSRLNEWTPLETMVIDVCLIIGENNDQEMKIVEINTLNSAGWYAGDVQKLVMALHEGYADAS